MKKGKIIFLLFCLNPGMQAKAQEEKDQPPATFVHEVGTMPLSYEYVGFQTVFLDRPWKLMPNVYYIRHRTSSNISWVAMLNYSFRNKPYVHYSEHDRYREHHPVLTVAPRYTWGQKLNWRLRPFVQPGLFVAYGHAQTTMSYTIDGNIVEDYGSLTKSFGFGVDLSAGVRFMLTPKFIFTLNARTQLGRSFYRNSGEGYRSGWYRDASSMIQPLQAGVGYVF